MWFITRKARTAYEKKYVSDKNGIILAFRTLPAARECLAARGYTEEDIEREGINFEEVEDPGIFDPVETESLNKSKRKIIAMIEVDDDRAIAEDMGTLDYLEREFKKLEKSGISLSNARILDDDDLYDKEALSMASLIFDEE